MGSNYQAIVVYNLANMPRTLKKRHVRNQSSSTSRRIVYCYYQSTGAHCDDETVLVCPHLKTLHLEYVSTPSSRGCIHVLVMVRNIMVYIGTSPLVRIRRVPPLVPLKPSSRQMSRTTRRLLLWLEFVGTGRHRSLREEFVTGRGMDTRGARLSSQ